MTNRVLSKLFPPSQSINILQCKKEIILPKICSEQKCSCSLNNNLQKHANHNQDSNSLSMNTTPNTNCPMCSPYLSTRFLQDSKVLRTQCNLKNVPPVVKYLRKYNNLGVTPFNSRRALMHTSSNGRLLLCTSFNEKTLRNRTLIISKESPYQGQIQLHTQKSELQPVVSEGIGWAGQPIVKRTHAILPEVYGDVSDVFTALNQLPNSQNCENDNKINDSTVQVQNSNPLQDQNNDPIELNSSECLHKNSNAEIDNCYDQNTMQSCIKAHDNIALMNSSNTLLSTHSESVPMTESVPMKSTELRQPLTNLVEQDLNKSESHYFDVKPKIILKSLKSKIKKKTKVVGVKHVKGLSKVKMGRKKKVKAFDPKRKHKPQPQLALCQRNMSLYYNDDLKNVLLTGNRQLRTDSALSYPRKSVALNKNKSKLSSDKTSKKASKGKREIALDDCICPETIEVKQKKTTKVCGEAAGGEKKEKKERKQKMCIIQPIIKYRHKTFVCASVHKYGKRKRQLPKCPEPEKKVAPRTEVCPPQIDEAKADAKKCVKQVEEVKIRKRSKVCKPVIIYAKEEASIKIEKTVCAESRVKQTISKHTKVCPPSNDKMIKSKRKRT